MRQLNFFCIDRIWVIIDWKWNHEHVGKNEKLCGDNETVYMDAVLRGESKPAATAGAWNVIHVSGRVVLTNWLLMGVGV